MEKTIKIEKLKLTHFKGIRSLDVDFAQVTDIRGDNATGKTTIMDAFLWLLFGKDSGDRTDFGLKYISPNGNGGPRDVEVEGLLEVEGRPVTLKRVYREKWSKRRGSETAELVGHETTFFVDEVPLKQGEYNERISKICDEGVFRAVTNPRYFPSLNWKVQRELLLDIAPVAPDELIASKDKDFTGLLNRLSGRTLAEYRSIIHGKKKKIEAEIKGIPGRIDEQHRTMGDMKDWAAIEKEIGKKKKEVEKIEISIERGTGAMEKQNEGRQGLMEDISRANAKMRKLRDEYEDKLHKDMREYDTARAQLEHVINGESRKITDLIDQIESKGAMIEGYTADLDALRKQWYAIDGEKFEFDEKAAICPTCQRELDPHDIEEKQEQMRQAFNKNKADRLAKAEGEGIKIRKRLEAEKNDILEASEKRGVMEAEQEARLHQYETMDRPAEPKPLGDTPGYKELQKATGLLKEKYEASFGSGDTTEAEQVSELKKFKLELLVQIEDMQKELAIKDQVERSEKRIKELEEEQQRLAQELANLEREEYIIGRFEKARVEEAEKSVNSMFAITRWRLFSHQVNGGEAPTCVATHKGVPYGDLNSAARVNVGIDIINVLSRHFEITAPIFIDNREGVNELINTPSQLINLIVSTDKELSITHQKEVAV